VLKKILLVEDDVHLQFLIKEELNEDGYDVVIASNGKEAISMLKQTEGVDADLIIMDIRMPVMDGIEAVGHILKSRINKPIILHSAYQAYKQDPLTMAADAYLVKSHDFTKLKAKISELLDKRPADYKAVQASA